MPATTVDTIVRGGQVVTSSEAYEASVAIRGEKIVALGPDEVLPPLTDTSMPRILSCQELSTAMSTSVGTTIIDGGIAAAHAGLTTIIPFALYDLAHRETYPRPSTAITKRSGRCRWSISPGTSS